MSFSNFSQHYLISLKAIFAALLVPAALLSTNLNFGLPIAETMPLLFLGVGILLMLAKGEVCWSFFTFIVVAILVFALFGLTGNAPMDGLRLAAAATIFFLALQFGAEREMLGTGCEIAIYVLFWLRVISIFIPEQMSSLYEMLGLRAAHLYGGGVAILFAEPSYLASATFSMWAIAKCAKQQAKCNLSLVDFCAVIILLLSGSASAAGYALIGLVILLRHRIWLLVIGVVLGVSGFGAFLALEGNRVSLFANAAVAMFSYGTIEDAIAAFVAVDPSASFRLAMAGLAVTATLVAPFGHFAFEMSRDLSSASAADSLGLYRGNQLLDSLVGNLQPSTVPFQFMYYGGWPLFGLIVLAVTASVVGIWSRRRENCAYPLMIAALLAGCVFQSVLTSPFFYLLIAFSIFGNRISQCAQTIDRGFVK